MAITGATLSNISEALKTFYLPAVRSQLNEEYILFRRLKRNEEDISGKNATMSMNVGFSSAIASIADGGALPTAGVLDKATNVVPMKYHVGRIEITGPTIKATRNDKGAWKRVVNDEIDNMVLGLKKDLNRQAWGCGYGILARWLSGGSTALVVQKLYRGNAAAPDGFGSTFGAKYIHPHDTDAKATRMVCVVLTGGTSIAIDATPMYPSAVVEGTISDTITVTDPSVTEAVGTFYVHGDATAASIAGTTAITRYEMMGLRGIVTDEVLDHILTDGTTPGVTTDDTLQGVAVSSYWKGNVRYCGNAGGATRYAQQNALTLDDMQRAFDAGPEALGAEYEPTLILMPYAIRRKVVDLLTGDRRYSTSKLDGGYTAIDFNGKPIVVDTDAIDGEMYFLYEPSLSIYRMSDFDWMDMDGAVLSRVSGYDAYEAVLFAYMELGVDKRRANSVLVDILY